MDSISDQPDYSSLRSNVSVLGRLLGGSPRSLRINKSVPFSSKYGSFGEDALGSYDMFTDIYTINQDEFGGPTKCLTKGQRENFLDNMMHELWHQNDPFFHQLNTKFFRMGNKYFGGYHRDMDEFTKYLNRQSRNHTG